MNNGITKSFELSPVVLTVEDDFLIKREYNITKDVETMVGNNVAGIRLAYLRTSPGSRGHTLTEAKHCRIPGYVKVVGGTVKNRRYRWVFNNQVMLRSRMAYDKLGLYAENCSSDNMEEDMCARYISMFGNGNLDVGNVLYPSGFLFNTLDNGLFVHIGRSTNGHSYIPPSAYEYINTRAADVDARKFDNKATPFFRIIIPAYNVRGRIGRCIRSIASQTFKDFVVSVCDDMSTDGTAEELNKLASENEWMKVTLSKTKLYNGGARNAALDAVRGRYTLYIDADDYFSDNNVLNVIHDTIVANGNPDAVRLSYVRRGRNGKLEVVRLTEGDPKSLACTKWGAPWCLCVRSDKVVKFPSDINAQVDVVHNLLQSDAIDSVASKAALILAATEKGVPIVSSMGAALRMDPTKVRVMSFDKVAGDGLARALRQRFKRMGRYPACKFSAVCSVEPPAQLELRGSLMQVTAAFGMALASEAVRILSE